METSFNRFKVKFIEEANVLLDQLEKDLLELEKQPESKELIESAFRSMHTIKGGGSMFGFETITSFTHELESLYQSIKENRVSFNKDIFNITFLSIDHLRKLLIGENQSNPVIIREQTDLLLTIKNFMQTSTGSVNYGIDDQTESEPGEDRTWQILLRTTESIIFRGINLMGIFQDLSQLGLFEISRIKNMSNEEVDYWNIILTTKASEDKIREVFIFIEDDCTFVCLSNQNVLEMEFSRNSNENSSISNYIENIQNQEVVSLINEKISVKNPAMDNIQSRTEPGNSRISVDSSKLDHLMYLVSELITLNSQFSLNIAGEKFERIRPLTEKLEYLSKQFRANALDIRLIPLSETIFRFKRLIRDLSKQLGKEVELVTEGIDTEVDKGTLDQLNDPMMHLIRNCIDHGLEEPAKRLQQGKPSKGIIKISASKSGNYIFIRIEDDGTGIDIEKIRHKAIEKGILKRTDNPSGQELMDMIFLPGFSMARNLTEISGRGVGMDIVKSRIAELRGEIIIETEIGKGTAFILKLQQSISIIDSLLFKVSDTFFTLPITDIVSCMEVSTDQVLKRTNTGTLVFEDEMIPFLDLKSIFNIECQYSEFLKAIIVISEGKKLAVLTDIIIGSHQAVVKPLGNLLKGNKHIGAASLLGDGKLAFMLETKELFS